MSRRRRRKFPNLVEYSLACTCSKCYGDRVSGRLRNGIVTSVPSAISLANAAKQRDTGVPCTNLMMFVLRSRP